MKKKCSVKNCNYNTIQNSLYCVMHRFRKYKFGMLEGHQNFRGHYTKAKNLKERILESIKIKKNNCWNWTGSRDGSGYGRFQFKNKRYQAHRVAYQEFINKIPVGLLVCHKCDNRLCCNPDHLFLGTDKDNVHDMIKKNRRVITEGVNHPMSKLTKQQVIAIRKSNKSDIVLSEFYGVHKSVIWEVKTRRKYKNIE